MKDEKILQDELMSDEELEQVAGGGYTKEDLIDLEDKLGKFLKESAPLVGKLIETFTDGGNSKN